MKLVPAGKFHQQVPVLEILQTDAAGFDFVHAAVGRQRRSQTFQHLGLVGARAGRRPTAATAAAAFPFSAVVISNVHIFTFAS